MSYFKLSYTLNISKEEAKNTIEAFFTAFPAVERFLKTLGEFAKTRGFIRTMPPLRRIRYFPTWYPSIYNSRDDFRELGSIERAGKNSPIQGRWPCLNYVNCWKAETLISSQGHQG